jgi:hypothetical protein
MSEQQTNPDSSDAADSTRAVEAKADGTNATAATSPGTAGGPTASASSTANEATSPGVSPDTSKPSNIVLYSPARARDEADRAAAQAKANAFDARAKWASRKVSRMVAVAAIAAAIGSISGALATLGVAHVSQRSAPAVATADETGLIKAALLQLETQLAAVKVNVDHATKISARIGERVDGFGGRIDSVEKTQADASLRIARIAEVQDKIRIAAASSAPAQAAPTPAAPQTTAASVPLQQPAPPRLPAGQVAQLPAQPETTGSIASGASEIKPKGDLKADYKAAEKAPIVGGWVLTSVGRRGNAIVASRNGYYEVFPGDPLPGVGRVQDIRYQDGRWVVITPKGLIVRK